MSLEISLNPNIQVVRQQLLDFCTPRTEVSSLGPRFATAEILMSLAHPVRKTSSVMSTSENSLLISVVKLFLHHNTPDQFCLLSPETRGALISCLKQDTSAGTLVSQVQRISKVLLGSVCLVFRLHAKQKRRRGGCLFGVGFFVCFFLRLFLTERKRST